MTIHSLILRPHEVTAFLSGQKTAHSLILKNQNWPEHIVARHPDQKSCVPWLPGDMIWCRESWVADIIYDELSPAGLAPTDGIPDAGIRFSADWGWRNRPPVSGGRRRAAQHMPRWASRLTLETVRCQIRRLQDLTEDEARAEGAPRLATDGEGSFFESDNGTHLCGYAGAIAARYGADVWESNPWVQRSTLIVHDLNIDDVLKNRAADSMEPGAAPGF